MERPTWLAPNFTEPRVLSVVRNLCRAGEEVFDVGANFGGITVAMSRAVGPKGAVFAFEANPGIAKRCQAAVVEAGCGNVQITHGAIYSESGKTIKLYLSENQVADSIHYKVSDKTIDVPTLALDDFVGRMNIRPSFVKMDIEGAEYDALVGFEKTIRFVRPLLILEQAPSESRCVEFLIGKGYSAIDLSTYSAIKSIDDLGPDVVVTDILFGFADDLERRGYTAGLADIETLTQNDFQTNGLIFDSRPLALAPGRYVVRAEFESAESETEEIFCGARYDGSAEPIMQHHGWSHNLSRLAHRWVFDVAAEGPTRVFFQFARNTPASFRIGDVVLQKVTCSGASPTYWV